MDDKPGAAEALTEPSTSITPTSLRSGEEKSDLHYQTMWQEAGDGTDMAKHGSFSPA